MKKLIFLLFVVLYSLSTKAQPYQTAAGVRLAYFSGLTIKHFVSSAGAIEGIMGYRWGGGVLVGLFEFEKEIPGASGLYFLVGGGVHIGYYQKTKYYYKHSSTYTIAYRTDDRVFSPGFDGVIGAEYKFSNIPLSLSLDFRPFIDFVEGTPPGYVDGGFSLRYTFD